MIDKVQFQSAIFALKENKEFERNVNKLFEGCYCNPLCDTVIDLLNKSMNLVESFNTIEWWVYELDFGKNGKDCIEIDGRHISLMTAEDLYDYLIEYETKEDDNNDK